MEATFASSSSAAVHPALLSESSAEDELASTDALSPQADDNAAAGATPAAVASIDSWIEEQSAAGHKPAVLYKSMLGVGWSEDAAFERLMKLGPVIYRAVGRAAHGQSQSMPEPRLDGACSTITLPDRTVRVLMQMRNPRVVVFGGFLSDAECDELIELAAPKMARSTVVNREDGSNTFHADRTSDGMFFQRSDDSPALVRRIEERIAALLNWPVSRGEGMQVLRYRPGAEYRPHYDYFNPTDPGTVATLKRGEQRVATLLMYLNTPDAGGSTTFPDIDAEVRALKGHAVFFSYDCPHPSSRTLHAGTPVIEGIKWVATKWLRQGEII